MKKADKPTEKGKDKESKKKDELRGEAAGYTKQSYDFVEELKKAGKEYTKEKESEQSTKKLEPDANPLLQKPEPENAEKPDQKHEMTMGNKKWKIEFSNVPEGDQKANTDYKFSTDVPQKRGSLTGPKSREEYILGAMYPSPHVTKDGVEEPKSEPNLRTEKRPEQNSEHGRRRSSLLGSPELDSKDLDEVDKFKNKNVIKLLIDAEDNRKRVDLAKQAQRKHNLNISEDAVQQRRMFSYMPGPLPPPSKTLRSESSKGLVSNVVSSTPLKAHESGTKTLPPHDKKPELSQKPVAQKVSSKTESNILSADNNNIASIIPSHPKSFITQPLINQLKSEQKSVPAHQDTLKSIQTSEPLPTTREHMKQSPTMKPMEPISGASKQLISSAAVTAPKQQNESSPKISSTQDKKPQLTPNLIAQRVSSKTEPSISSDENPNAKTATPLQLQTTSSNTQTPVNQQTSARKSVPVGKDTLKHRTSEAVPITLERMTASPTTKPLEPTSKQQTSSQVALASLKQNEPSPKILPLHAKKPELTPKLAAQQVSSKTEPTVLSDENPNDNTEISLQNKSLSSRPPTNQQKPGRKSVPAAGKDTLKQMQTSETVPTTLEPLPVSPTAKPLELTSKISKSLTSSVVALGSLKKHEPLSKIVSPHAKKPELTQKPVAQRVPSKAQPTISTAEKLADNTAIPSVPKSLINHPPLNETKSARKSLTVDKNAVKPMQTSESVSTTLEPMAPSPTSKPLEPTSETTKDPASNVVASNLLKTPGTKTLSPVDNKPELGPSPVAQNPTSKLEQPILSDRNPENDAATTVQPKSFTSEPPKNQINSELKPASVDKAILQKMQTSEVEPTSQLMKPHPTTKPTEPTSRAAKDPASNNFASDLLNTSEPLTKTLSPLEKNQELAPKPLAQSTPPNAELPILSAGNPDANAAIPLQPKPLEPTSGAVKHLRSNVIAAPNGSPVFPGDAPRLGEVDEQDNVDGEAEPKLVSPLEKNPKPTPKPVAQSKKDPTISSAENPNNVSSAILPQPRSVITQPTNFQPKSAPDNKDTATPAKTFPTPRLVAKVTIDKLRDETEGTTQPPEVVQKSKPDPDNKDTAAPSKTLPTPRLVAKITIDRLKMSDETVGSTQPPEVGPKSPAQLVLKSPETKGSTQPPDVVPKPPAKSLLKQFQFKTPVDLKSDPIQADQVKATKVFANLFNKNIPLPVKVDEIAQLKEFGIPDQEKSLELLLDDDSVEFDFGGLMRQYYSYVLRSYSLINMQERYRGASKFSKCFTTLDVSKIGSKEEEQDKTTERKMKKLETQMQDLKAVAVDQDHFNYLKNLAHTQPITLPLTILHGITEEMVPVLEDFFRFYGKNLGMDHHCTKKAATHYVKMRKRMKMYSKISGGTSHFGRDEKK